ncbi:uncharacterized protein LOC129774498, partial [Toxorhynchites rutilus septentrionalis]|uniref:uncharacterized protein LOC129774498 n=1 Tax=Toxorhynchites rutilus septentrionalis TaxID=329112 RepID=UPI00247A1280
STITCGFYIYTYIYIYIYIYLKGLSGFVCKPIGRVVLRSLYPEMYSLRTKYEHFIRFDDTSDPLRFVGYLHKFIGLNLVNPKVIKIWRLSIFLMIVQALCFGYRLYMVSVNGSGVSYIVCAMNVVGGFVSGGIRTRSFRYFYNDFVTFRKDMLQCLRFQRDDTKAQRIRREHHENNLKFTLAVLSAGVSLITIWNLTDYRMNDQYRIPFDLSFLNDTVQSGLDSLFGFYILTLAAHFWIPFVTIRVALRTLRAELLILNCSFEKLFHRALERSTMLVSTNSMEHIDDDRFWQCLEAELAQLVIHHKLLLINVDRIRRLASVPFLAEMFASVSIPSIAVFLFLLLGSENLSLFGISCIVMFEFYYNSSLVEELEDAHADTGEAIYRLEWPLYLRYDGRHARQYKNVRNSLLIGMMRSNQRLHFHCGGMYEMSMKTFSVTVKTCYTILTFLMQLTT